MAVAAANNGTRWMLHRNLAGPQLYCIAIPLRRSREPISLSLGVTATGQMRVGTA